MASGTQKKIDEIDDILEMGELMKGLGISCKGLTTLEQMKEAVKTTLHETSKKPTWNAGEAFSILSEAIDEDTRKRRILLDLFKDTEGCLMKIDKKFLNLLQIKVPNVKENMENHKLQLTRKEYFVLVAGETSSGKSSLINLIMGEKIFPYSVLSTTSTICELKFGKQRKIVAHFKDKDPETHLPTKEIHLKDNPEKDSYLQQISPYVHMKSEREKGSIYKKIELFWPHSLLETGIVIIDSPGVGESELMDEIVTQYLPQAFAFIYVINSPNAGGVQKDIFQKLLENVRNVYLEGKGQLPSKCALFVCNKWDQVTVKEAEKTKTHIVKNLKRCWPGLDPASQIICMSTLNATKGQNVGIVTNDFSSLMEGIKSMVLKGTQCRLEIHWRWLDVLLSRIILQAKAFLSNDREVFFKIMGTILKRLVDIDQLQSQEMKKLERDLNTRIDGAIRELSKYLSTEEVKKRFTSWTPEDAPKAERSWEATDIQIQKVLLARIRDIIEQWEENKQVFSNARNSLLKHSQEHYNFVAEQLRNLHNVVVDNVQLKQVPQKFHTQTSSTESGLTVGAKFAIGVTSPIWVPLGLVALIIGAPILGVIATKEKLKDRKTTKFYANIKCTYMEEVSAEYLDDINNDRVLRPFVKDQLKEAKLCIQNTKVRISELIRADKMLCEQLYCETRLKQDIIKLYRPILDDATEFLGKLAVFGFKDVFGEDVNEKTLEWKEDASHLLGSGASGLVYKGTMTKDQHARPVALKVYKEALKPTNACEIMAEVELLRKLRHLYIVKFYGTSLLNDDGETRVILVMEKCEQTLKSRLHEKPQSCPGKARNPGVFREVCQWVIQITDALDYIHKQGIIHRDLKLGNILLSEDNTIRVTDVGASKPAIDITGTLAGTPVYIAPEVFNSEIYEFSADIYSLGIMLWEMWYGQQAFGDVRFTLEEFFNHVNNGFRPAHNETCINPPNTWEKLMKKCWATNPTQRPSAKKCKQVITHLCQET
ncbi:dual serine/threonine and tyrosine protein kinase-like isoform X1 [Montipora capricornis]|uniref:dual serine/threonine and tyrosine protein kinase-like isoform X1 n=2 Tax=Montipora capricornis TaxID=246305 RepID=UPI0035F20F5C